VRSDACRDVRTPAEAERRSMTHRVRRESVSVYVPSEERSEAERRASLRSESVYVLASAGDVGVAGAAGVDATLGVGVAVGVLAVDFGARRNANLGLLSTRVAASLPSSSRTCYLSAWSLPLRLSLSLSQHAPDHSSAGRMVANSRGRLPARCGELRGRRAHLSRLRGRSLRLQIS
jgi:hypothetical protein